MRVGQWHHGMPKSQVGSAVLAGCKTQGSLEFGRDIGPLALVRGLGGALVFS